MIFWSKRVTVHSQKRLENIRKLDDMAGYSDIPTFPLTPRRRISGVGFGEFKSPRRGIGYDFRGIRPWTQGDDVRQIDQRTTARQSSVTGKYDPQVREQFAEVSLRAMLVIDRSPRMERFSKDLPWLHKPDVIVNAGRMIVASCKRAGAMVGYLDFADYARDPAPFFRSANQETEARKIIEKYLPHKHFTAPSSTMTDALTFLLSRQGALVRESFLFLCSDFVDMPPYDLLEQAAARWDLFPVVIQDPRIEASFPEWSGLPAFLPLYSSMVPAFVTTHKARRYRVQHEARIAAICDTFDRLRAPTVVVTTEKLDAINNLFNAHAQHRALVGR